MIVKSYELPRKITDLLKYNIFLAYGENVGLKKDIKNLIQNNLKKNNNIEVLSLYENEIIDREDNFYNSIYSGSLFSEIKLITVQEVTDKLLEKIEIIYSKYPKNVFLILFSDVLEKKSKLRSFFETKDKTICIPCYSDNERDLSIIAQSELKKDNINLSRESLNLLVEKSNADRNNLKNEIEKIKSYALNKKKIEIDELKSLINFSGDHKSDILVNECLCGNVPEYKKIISELYINTVNQILLLRILSNKMHRLLKLKEQVNNLNNIDNIINTVKPAIFWKEKPLIKKQLSIWKINDIKKIIFKINDTELQCKKNPLISKFIFFNFFSEICKKANNYS